MVGVGRLRQRDRERHGKSRGARDAQDTTHGLILRCLAVLHSILLSRMVRTLWNWLVQSRERSPAVSKPWALSDSRLVWLSSSRPLCLHCVGIGPIPGIPQAL